MFKKNRPLFFGSAEQDSSRGVGVTHKGKTYVTHTNLNTENSALINFYNWQKLFILCFLSVITFGLLTNFLFTIAFVISVLSLIYFIDVVFNFFLIARSLHKPAIITTPAEEIEGLKDEDLPTYTVLCPLYKEANVLPNFIEAVENISWPKDKLDIILLLEEDDKETLEELGKLDVPPYFRHVIVPYSLPKTKPKACNYGLTFAKGEYLVVYDAEDIPDPLQLKKAYIAFEKSPRDIICLQAKLNYHNVNQNVLTRLFTAEYSLWFDLILMGLQSIKTAIPLGGTSNHFPTAELKKLHGWDPFNVTEDADLGVRLFKEGFRTAVIDSVTLEEANSQPRNWVRQRSRWLKGYMQTFLVHMRSPVKFTRDFGIHAFIFQLLVGGKIMFMFINPILWLVTILYFPLYSTIGPTINSLYIAPVFYMAITALVFGNFMYMYYFMIGCAKRGHWQVIKYIFLAPFYWLMGSYAATIALYQLIFKPHFWEKTAHGLNLEKKNTLQNHENTAQPGPVFKPATAGLRLGFIRLFKNDLGSGSVLIAAALISNFLNFIYNAYLARALSIEEFGLISLMGSFMFLITIPAVALSRTVTNKTANYLGKYGEIISDFWQSTRKRTIKITATVAIIWLLLTPLFPGFFNTDNLLAFVLFTPVWIIAAAAAVDEGFLSGNHKFEIIGVLLITEALARLAFSWLLIQIGLSTVIYIAIPASLLVSFSVGWLYASNLKKNSRKHAISDSLHFPTNFLFTSLLEKISVITFISLDLILAKHFLPSTEAGQYALLSLSGKIIFFVGALISQFITPIISKEDGQGLSSQKTFNRIFALTILSAVSAYVVFGLMGSISAPILFGQKAVEITAYLPLYGLAILLFTIYSTIVLFHQTKRANVFPAVSFAVAVLQVFLISLFHGSLLAFVNVMFAVSAIGAVMVAAMHFFPDNLKTISNNLQDLTGLFKKEKNEPKLTGYNVLILNWRDMKHKWAGGAEVYSHEIAKKLIKNGNRVTVFCGNDGDSRSNEYLDGVEIIRRGGFYMVYVWAFLYYIFKFRNKYDLIIDCENGIPFFTPIYSKVPVIGLVHHVHREIFRTQLAFPFAKFAQFLEGFVMPLVYKNTKLITVSQSTKNDLRTLGFGGEIEIINPGIHLSSYSPTPKNITPQIIYLGRLKPYKSIETLIAAMKLVIAKYPQAKLKIAGTGESEENLKSLTRTLGLSNNIEFLGKVTEDQKRLLLATSWAAVIPSMMEGWGITAIEANASGTPVIASNVHGLKDSVKDGTTGLLFPFNDASILAEKISFLVSDKKMRLNLETGAVRWAQNFSWDTKTQLFYQSILFEAQKARAAGFVKDFALVKGETV